MLERRKVDPPVDVHGSQISEVVSKITWTAAAGGGVKPGAGIQPDVQAVDDPRTKRDEALNRALQTLAGEAQ